jgi:hypothetical protein
MSIKSKKKSALKLPLIFQQIATKNEIRQGSAFSDTSSVKCIAFYRPKKLRLRSFFLAFFFPFDTSTYLTNSNSNKVYIKPYFKFRVAFTDEEGNIIYCQPEVEKKNKYGYTKCYHIGEVEIIR